MWQLYFKAQSTLSVKTHQIWNKLSVCFPSSSSSEDDDNLENLSLERIQSGVSRGQSIQSSCSQQRLQCFAHILQLVVQDGPKQTLNSHLIRMLNATRHLVCFLTALQKSLQTFLQQNYAAALVQKHHVSSLAIGRKSTRKGWPMTR